MKLNTFAESIKYIYAEILSKDKNGKIYSNGQITFEASENLNKLVIPWDVNFELKKELWIEIGILKKEMKDLPTFYRRTISIQYN